jgi:hypothetical protein
MNWRPPVLDPFPSSVIIPFVPREDRALLGSNPSARGTNRRWAGAPPFVLTLRPFLPSLVAQSEKPNGRIANNLPPALTSAVGHMSGSTGRKNPNRLVQYNAGNARGTGCAERGWSRPNGPFFSLKANQRNRSETSNNPSTASSPTRKRSAVQRYHRWLRALATGGR